MNSLSIIALFCESIREEKGNLDTLVGILPDIVLVPKFPGMFPALGVYVRANFSTTDEIHPINIYLSNEKGRQLVLSFTREIMEQAREGAIAKEVPVAGLLSKILFANFGMEKPGRADLVAECGERTIVCGTLSFHSQP